MHSKQTSIFGFTLIETLIGVAIVVIIATVVAVNLSSFTKKQQIDNGVDESIALFNEARSRTVSAFGGNQYGVRVSSGSLEMFTGTTYSSASSNKIVTLPSGISTVVSIAGGGTDIVFEEMTGDTNQYGTVIIKNSSTTVGQKTITISKTGIASSN
jgi:prepilin-type N-terminal cleavage/methylation domain-containing protein